MWTTSLVCHDVKNLHLEKVIEKLEQSDLQGARSMLMEMIPEANPIQETKIFRLIGYSYIKNSEWNQALPWFSRVSRDSLVASDLFNLALCQVNTGNVQEALDTFTQLEITHEEHPSQETSFYIHLFWFMMALINVDQMETAAIFAKRLISAYERTRFTDSKFLKEVGLPEFDEFIQGVTVIGRKVPSLIEEVKKMTLDERGTKMIQSLVNAPKFENLQ